ncbi:hypothetical protein ACFW9F_22610 [Streptomyces sp. NPDC059506]|uniref:hypothetical protein n=1 Tax=Streptomyces sp. NPDC059506 TaxID=3347751 RepID=UPI0036BF3FF9
MPSQRPDLNAGDLPPLTPLRPNAHPSHPRRTVRDLFGHSGLFFTVPGTFPAGLPDHITHTDTVYAVVRIPDTTTDAFVVHDVDGNRHRIGRPAPDCTAAIRSALTELATHRRRRAQQIEYNRIHVLGLEPAPPVRIGTSAGTCIVHTRCFCPHVEGLAAHFEHVSVAADDWLNEAPDTPWQFCPTSPQRITTPTASGRITRTCRTDQGTAAVEIEHDADGRRILVPLREVTNQT